MVLLRNMYEGEEIYLPDSQTSGVCAAVMGPSFQPIGGDVIKLAGMVDEGKGSFRQRSQLWRDLQRVLNTHPHKH